MDPPEIALHSFVVKVWVEDAGSDDGPAVLRGHVTHVLSGDRRYFAALEAIPAFIAPYLESTPASGSPGAGSGSAGSRRAGDPTAATASPAMLAADAGSGCSREHGGTGTTNEPPGSGQAVPRADRGPGAVAPPTRRSAGQQHRPCPRALSPDRAARECQGRPRHVDHP